MCVCSKAKIERPWYRENDTEERNEKARRAYEALMTVTLRKPDSHEYKTFSEEVKRRARQQYGDSVYGEEEVRDKPGHEGDLVCTELGSERQIKSQTKHECNHAYQHRY